MEDSERGNQETSVRQKWEGADVWGLTDYGSGLSWLHSVGTHQGGLGGSEGTKEKVEDVECLWNLRMEVKKCRTANPTLSRLGCEGSWRADL